MRLYELQQDKDHEENVKAEKLAEKKFKSRTINLLNEILVYCHPASAYTGNIYRAIKKFKKDNFVGIKKTKPS